MEVIPWSLPCLPQLKKPRRHDEAAMIMVCPHQPMSTFPCTPSRFLSRRDGRRPDRQRVQDIRVLICGGESRRQRRLAKLYGNEGEALPAAPCVQALPGFPMTLKKELGFPEISCGLLCPALHHNTVRLRP